MHACVVGILREWREKNEKKSQLRNSLIGTEKNVFVKNASRWLWLITRKCSSTHLTIWGTKTFASGLSSQNHDFSQTDYHSSFSVMQSTANPKQKWKFLAKTSAHISHYILYILGVLAARPRRARRSTVCTVTASVYLWVCVRVYDNRGCR